VNASANSMDDKDERNAHEKTTTVKLII